MKGSSGGGGDDASTVNSETVPQTAAAAAPATSSGFSFLQTNIGGATSNETTEPSSTAAVSVSAVAAPSATESSSLGGGGGSAFGFLSGDNNNNNAVATATAETNNANINNSEVAGVGSGFSFMNSSSSSSAATAVMPPPTQESNGTTAPAAVDVASNVSTAGSSFSFMNSMMSGSNNSDSNGESTTTTTTVVTTQPGGGSSVGEVKEESIADAPTSTTASSGFSFLSGAAATTAPPQPPPSQDNTSPIPQSKPSIGGGGSMFAGFNTTETSSSTTTTTSVEATPPPPPPKPESDLLSMSSPALPAGAGVSWGSSVGGGGAGAAGGVVGAKKVVKKKRGKRVGVGSSAAAAAPTPLQQPQQSIPTPTVPSTSFQPQPPLATTNATTPAYQPTPNPPTTGYHHSSPMASQIKTIDENGPQPQMSPPMRVKAEMAMQNAEEFIKEKQRSAIAMAAERAMNEKTSESGSGGGWKMSNNTTDDTPNDSEYEAAKAAAQEARTMSAGKGMTKTSLFSGVSGFFGRKSPNTSGVDASAPSYSSHGGVLNNILPVRRTNSSSSASTLTTTVEGESQYEGAVDPIQRENDEAKRAMAERDMAMFREKQLQEQERLQRKKEEEEKQQVEQERLRQLEEEAKRRSPREKMQTALDQFADVTRTSTDYVSQLRAKRAELVKERSEAEKTERFAAQQISYAEAQQMQAAEDEDFEAADRLASDIERHTMEKNKQTEIVKSIDDAISHIEKQKEAASESVVSCFTDINTKLKELQAEVDDRKKEDEILDQFAKTSKRLSSETERLSNDLKHIERDESVLADEQKELENQITEQTKEFDEKRTEASAKLEVVDEEIEELRKKLAEAEEKAASLNKEISSYNDSIESVRSKYSRQLGRLEKKDRSVKESRAEWQIEQESIEKAKAAHESVVAAHSEEMLTREKLIEEIKVEISAASDFVEVVSKAFDATEMSGDHNEEFDSEVLKYEAAVDEANNNVASAESNIKNLEDEISSIDVRVPILEAEKKVAAAKRDFKSAGKASKEIKDALARKEQCEAELSGEAMERKQATKEELQQVTVLLEEKKSIAAEKGKEMGLKRMDTLREKIANLQSIVKEFGSVSGDSDSINVSCVGAFVIDSQISVLEAEGIALGEKYGGWVSVSATGDVDDSSDAADETTDKDDATSDMAIDDDTLQKYSTLTTEIEELEMKIEKAAADEDYDTATDLEEKAESLRLEIKSLGHSPEKMAQALKDNDMSASKENSTLDSSVLDKYAALKTQLEQIEADIEIAVADENFEEAAELEEKVQVAKSEIESLGFSVDDLEQALKNGLNIDHDVAEEEVKQDSSSGSPPRSDSSYEVVEKEACNTKENGTPNDADTVDTEENDAKEAQNPSESDDAQVVEEE